MRGKVAREKAKAKRKRRTKAEMEAARAAEVEEPKRKFSKAELREVMEEMFAMQVDEGAALPDFVDGGGDAGFEGEVGASGTSGFGTFRKIGETGKREELNVSNIVARQETQGRQIEVLVQMMKETREEVVAQGGQLKRLMEQMGISVM
jgi:hypothetical protein